jgi:predicted MFS family arabinose efflux permease
MNTRTKLRRRLLPLQVAAFLQGVLLWLPVEKLFMSEIGFDAASIGVMAAVYAAVVPIVEVPSGILSDRWSRRGVLVVSSVALTLVSLIGGLSQNVATYMLSAVVLGVYFAMYSGTMESVVYDTVLEETGDGAGFERQFGRINLVNSVGLVLSSLAGGWLAGLTSTRLTYYVTVPVVAVSVVALLRFDEPRLHKSEQSNPLWSHVATTYRAVTGQRRLLPIVALAALTAVLLQVIFEFGPLWLVALSAAAIVYGPYMAGLLSALGLGGLLAGRLRLDRPAPLAVAVGLMTLASLVLTVSRNALVVTAAQIVLALLLVTASIHVTRLLHDAIPSSVRSGVASGVGALSWLTVLPFALAFGFVTKTRGVYSAGWMIVAVTLIAGGLLAKVSLADRREPANAPEPEEAPAPANASAPEPASAGTREPALAGVAP